MPLDKRVSPVGTGLCLRVLPEWIVIETLVRNRLEVRQCSRGWATRKSSCSVCANQA
jgi:hypothetical protein